MLISVYAWVVMLLSLPLMLLASKVELRAHAHRKNEKREGG